MILFKRICKVLLREVINVYYANIEATLKNRSLDLGFASMLIKKIGRISSLILLKWLKVTFSQTTTHSKILINVVIVVKQLQMRRKEPTLKKFLKFWF